MRILISLVLALLLASPVLAAKSQDEQPAGGFEGPTRGAEAQTVAKALKLDNDARVVLVGNIVAKDADSKNGYFFKDASGEMLVLIPPKQFKGETIKPEMQVRLSGKIDKPADSKDPARLRVNQLSIVK